MLQAFTVNDFDTIHQITGPRTSYFDRLRIRTPGDNPFMAVSPHIDKGNRALGGLVCCVLLDTLPKFHV